MKDVSYLRRSANCCALFHRIIFAIRHDVLESYTTISFCDIFINRIHHDSPIEYLVDTHDTRTCIVICMVIMQGSLVIFVW